jgi:hypothetical protein
VSYAFFLLFEDDENKDKSTEELSTDFLWKRNIRMKNALLVVSTFTQNEAIERRDVDWVTVENPPYFDYDKQKC